MCHTNFIYRLNVYYSHQGSNLDLLAMLVLLEGDLNPRSFEDSKGQGN